MERKKLLLTVAIVFTVFIIGVIFLIWNLTPAQETPEPKPTETTIVETEKPVDPNHNYDEDGALIKPDPDAEDNPPADMYANNYDDDTGYAPLPEGFVPTDSNIVGTVYEEQWALTKMYTLFCELSTKNTSTERARAPLENFSNDLAQVKYENGPMMLTTISDVLTDYRAVDKQRVPGDLKNEVATLCSFSKYYTNNDPIDGVHNH